MDLGSATGLRGVRLPVRFSMPFVRRLHCKDSFLGADGVSPPPRWDKHGTGSPDWTVNGANNYVTLTKTSVSAQSCNFWRATAQRDDLSIEFSGYVRSEERRV